MITNQVGGSRFSSVGRASGSQIFWEHKFESRQPHLCNSMWGQDRLHAGCQEVGKCSTRGGSRGMYITFASAMQIRQPTLALKPRGDVTRNPKQGYQWPQKWTCVRPKTLKKKKKKGGRDPCHLINIKWLSDRLPFSSRSFCQFIFSQTCV